MRQETHTSGALARHLPTFLIVLMAIQPLMDILSFWTDRLGMSNTITLLLRFAVFAVVCVLGFVTSSRPRRSTASLSPPAPSCSSGTASPVSSSATNASSMT